MVRFSWARAASSERAEVSVRAGFFGGGVDVHVGEFEAGVLVFAEEILEEGCLLGEVGEVVLVDGGEEVGEVAEAFGLDAELVEMVVGDGLGIDGSAEFADAFELFEEEFLGGFAVAYRDGIVMIFGVGFGDEFAGGAFDVLVFGAAEVGDEVQAGLDPAAGDVGLERGEFFGGGAGELGEVAVEFGEEDIEIADASEGFGEFFEGAAGGGGGLGGEGELAGGEGGAEAAGGDAHLVDAAPVDPLPGAVFVGEDEVELDLEEVRDEAGEIFLRPEVGGFDRGRCGLGLGEGERGIRARICSSGRG